MLKPIRDEIRGDNTAKLVMADKISLKNHPEIREYTIQHCIFDNPAALGLGDISPIRRENEQPSGGRLDLKGGSHYHIAGNSRVAEVCFLAV